VTKPHEAGAKPGLPHEERRRAPASADLLLLGAVSLAALNYSAVKLGVSEITPLAFPVFRFGVGGLVLLAILRLREGSVFVRRADVPTIVLVGLLAITLGQIGFVFALANTSASDTALLQASGPIMTAVMAALAGNEQPGRRHWFGALLGLAGFVMIIGGGTHGLQLGSNLFGDALALFTVVTTTAATLPIMGLLRRYSPYRILAWEMLIGTAFLVPLAIPGLVTMDYGSVTAAGLRSLAYTTLGGGVVMMLLYFTAMARVGPSRAAVFQYLQVFIAVLLAVVLLGEQVTPAQLVGGVTVVAGIVIGRTTRPEAGAVPREHSGAGGT
jgi:drug/metabolite transporter (DMT)-like permease